MLRGKFLSAHTHSHTLVGWRIVRGLMRGVYG